MPLSKRLWGQLYSNCDSIHILQLPPMSLTRNACLVMLHRALEICVLFCAMVDYCSYFHYILAYRWVLMPKYWVLNLTFYCNEHNIYSRTIFNWILSVAMDIHSIWQQKIWVSTHKMNNFPMEIILSKKAYRITDSEIWFSTSVFSSWVPSLLP